MEFEIRKATLPVHRFVKVTIGQTTIDLGLLTAVEAADLADILRQAAEDLTAG